MPTMLPRRPRLALVLCVLGAACGDGTRSRADTMAAADTLSRAPAPASGVPASAPASDIPAAALESAARDIVGFLRGSVPFERLALADTVTLYIAPEGGSASAAIARERLRDTAQWAVRDDDGLRRPFAPPPGLARLATRAGRHFACHEYPLAPLFPELAARPHVGAKLEASVDASCLQTWNVTFVFDPGARPPRLVAAVYDQWEW